MYSREPLAHAIDYNRRVLAQAQDLVARCGDAEAFATQVGPHLRHILEHYEEFLRGVRGGIIDYDARGRDRRMERDAARAAARFETLSAAVRDLASSGDALPESIAVSQQGGLDGDERFIAMSSPLRELMFLASHAIHHFAVLKPALDRAGITLPATFGKAPGTVRHERQTR